LEINDDIKREMAFYNLTRDNVMQGMRILVQAQVPISRPDDFLAEMLKTDVHMSKVKSQLLKQQHKIQKFEEKKSKQENKKFHKAIKNFTQQKRHQEKRDNVAAIDELKEKIKKSGGDIETKEFDKIMLKTGSKEGLDPAKGQKTKERVKVVDQIKNKQAPAPFARAKKGEAGRLGKGRFNREFAVQKEKVLNGEAVEQKPDFKKGQHQGGRKPFERKPAPNSGGFKPDFKSKGGNFKNKGGAHNKRSRPGKSKRGNSGGKRR